MKKIIYVFVVCATLLTITYYCYVHPDFTNNIVKKGYEIYEEKFGEKLPEYNSDFIINKLVEESDIYYYNTLTDNQKNIYIAIANAVKNLNSEFELIEYEYIDEPTRMLDEIIGFCNRFSIDELRTKCEQKKKALHAHR